jgi:hypothetical protein
VKTQENQSQGRNKRKTARCIKKSSKDMLLDLEEGLVQETLLKFSQQAFIRWFRGRELSEKTLRGWAAAFWGKSLGYVPKFHMGSRGFNIILFKGWEDRDNIKIGGPDFNHSTCLCIRY